MKKIDELWPITTKLTWLCSPTQNQFFLEGTSFGATPLKFWMAENLKIWLTFGQLQTLIADISRTDPAIDKLKTALSTTIPPTFDGKN